MDLRSAPILVATDFSTRSDRALRRATMIARQFGTSLTLVHVVDDDQPRHLIESRIQASREMLEEGARTIARVDDVGARATVVSGDVSTGILHVADEIGAGLIVLGPHRRALRDAFMGTTAERTIARARRPVLVAAGVPSAPYARAMIALGIDEASRAAVHRLRELQLLERSEIMPMHAFDAPAQGMMRRAMSEREAIDHYVANEERRANEEFGAFVREVGLTDARPLLRPVNGTVARTVIEAAREEGADLIVLGTSQQSGLKRMLLGSVAAEVIGDADCDVLVVADG